ncbi:hypothetical protein G6F22_022105 [Rhizopus arrhizus]|nr:hypothetical protein G6F22_022105 [Rhizopus arrhizus]
MPAVSMIFCHLAVSRSISCLNSSGEPVAGSAPSVARPVRTSGACRAFWMAAFSVATTSAGVPLGATTPPQATVS